MEPPANYASTGVGATTPLVTSTGKAVGYDPPGAGYPTAQYPYPTTAPGAAPSNYAPAYTASTAGVPGACADGTSPAAAAGTGGSYGSTGAAPASPYSGANPYASPVAAPYNTTPSTPSYNSTVGASGGYAPAGASSDDSRNPVRSATSYPSTDPSRSSGSTGSYNATSDRYGRREFRSHVALPPVPTRDTMRNGSGYGTDARVTERLLQTFPVRREPMSRRRPATAMLRRATVRRR